MNSKTSPKNLYAFNEIAEINPPRTIKKGTVTKYLSMDSVNPRQKHVSKIEYRKYNGGSKFKKNDILFARITPSLEHGKTCIVDFLKDGEIGAGSTEFIVISSRDGLTIPDYLYYLTTSNLVREPAIKSMTGTSGRQRVDTSVFDSIIVPIPPLKEQKAIAKILSDLDSKIELNQKMNKTLEALAQVIFKHWFIDFEFPNEEGKPYKSSGGEMVDSELGDIPKGWEVRKLADLMYLEKGLSYKGKFLSESGIPLINLGCISPKGGFINEGIKYYIGDFSKRHTVEVGDILIANTDITQKREILGSPMIVPDNLDMKSTILFTHHLYAVRFLDSINTKNKEFVYCLMKTRNYGDYVKTYATGTTVLAIPKEAVHNFKFAYPNEVLMNYFSDLSKNIINKMQRNQNFNNLLSAVRDSILPKLMSGKIRVPLEE